MRKFCAVCHQLGDGNHFGAVACKACAAFFRRSTTLNLFTKFVCTKSNNCTIKMSTRDFCKSCRYRKCVAVGMNQEAVHPKCVIENVHIPSSSSHQFQNSEQSPNLSKYMGSYQKLCQKRCNFYAPKQTPRATTCEEFSKIYINDVCLQYQFLEDCFPQFQQMNCFEKKHVFKNFFVSFLLLEIGFKSLRHENNLFFLANGDFIDTMHLDEYYHDRNHVEKCKPTDAVKMYSPYFEQLRRNVFQPICYQEISMMEFVALVSWCTWNEGLENQPDTFYPHCRPIRQSIITELLSFYSEQYPTHDPALKLSRLLMLIPSVERSVELFVQTVEVKRLFRCFPFHEKINRIINGE